MAAPGPSYGDARKAHRRQDRRPAAGPQTFEVRAAASTMLTASDRKALDQFLRNASALQRAALGASGLVGESLDRLALVKKAIDSSRAADTKLAEEARALQQRLQTIQIALDGDRALARRNSDLTALVDRSGYLVNAHWTSTSAPTATSRRQYDIASADLAKLLADLHQGADRSIRPSDFEVEVEAIGLFIHSAEAAGGGGSGGRTGRAERFCRSGPEGGAAGDNPCPR